MRFLLVGDIIGKPGRKALRYFLASYPSSFDAVIVNVENSAGGFGITRKVYEELKKLGVDVLTSGNHIWDKKEVLEIIDEPDLLRPANYPKAPGKGYGLYEKRGVMFGVINLMGRVFLDCQLENPFLTFDNLYDQLSRHTPIVLVDFHAETTSEKWAFGIYADGRASVVYGTHTHVPTADQIILPGGTGYVTDIGMTGCWYSVIGMKHQQAIQRFLTGMPQRYEVEEKGDVVFNAVIAEVEETKGRCVKMERVQLYISQEELREL
ncbi:metallophosphoesterase [Thermocrinis albus DSM 14484]|uniref:Metallophosphoesterase n=1 Tax=Thermocrinis albus (strain DSM 14484 / JCM 11386 / HI 11/12) TaxID=638303 RepID=D3SPJ8_THEAH|nr:TIGR00282 family metallophosphoesterase [Thermocrinis albus]ADC89085.1 metallophosphoesterase [Thermocrinis albus DSM 14484]